MQVEGNLYRAVNLFAFITISLISSLPPFRVGGVGGRLVMLVSLGGRLFELILTGLSTFRYRRARMVVTVGFVGYLISV